MNLLLDTHVLLWWGEQRSLSPEAAAAIADPDNLVYVSAASIWEISIKRARGKLDVGDAVFDVHLDGFEPLPITHADARMAGGLPDFHRDPFDRMLIAQALGHDLTLVTRDHRMDAYEASILPA